MYYFVHYRICEPWVFYSFLSICIMYFFLFVIGSIYYNHKDRQTIKYLEDIRDKEREKWKKN